ncbi:MAG: hypothetical protein ABFD92_06385 [Planctomycetaceae bacterium]|nr:hypothetical protein [Planctomycetaceae bacterium]
MSRHYSQQTCRELAAAFDQQNLIRPMRVTRFESGQVLTYDVTGVWPARKARVGLVVERFVGGGFAGQVYQVTVNSIDAPDGPVAGLSVGAKCAMKILVPPSRGAEAFRNAVYFAGFQAPFALQVNPAAARAGALWQKFIRRAAALRLGSEQAVVDIFCTFVDPALGSCGELSEWINGRTWRFEANDHLDLLALWRRGKLQDAAEAGSAEYRAKRQFMADFVTLLHDMGAHEFARQYEWSTCKSQPNCLKRLETEGRPAEGLTAVDFRAGLALLACLPMSPGDFKLIGKGLARGRLVQFDRGDLRKLDAFIVRHREHFADMHDALAELRADEEIYRNSQIDLAGNHVRLLHSRRLWAGIADATVNGWRISNVIDDACAASLKRSRLRVVLFALAGWLGVAGVAAAAGAAVWAHIGGFLNITLAAGLGVGAAALVFAGRAVRTLWGRGDYRRHWGRVLTSFDYFTRAMRGRMIERMIEWVRALRVDSRHARQFLQQPWRQIYHLPLSVAPVFLHRLLSDATYAVTFIKGIVLRPVQLYFNPSLREQWMRDMVADGHAHGMLSDADRDAILSRLGEPYIQKYLKCLAVHVCTLPITQVVSLAIAVWYVLSNPQMKWEQAWGVAVGILVFFQVIPVSPGSLARGLYVLYMVIRERSVKDYNIALFLGFFKYIGYLAFPIQMAYRYPELSRFMAGHWATGAVHIVPVFGERGALLEYGAFNLFYNRPLTLRRKMGERAAQRRSLPVRLWHVAPVAVATTALLIGADFGFRRLMNDLPHLREIAVWVMWPALAVGMLVAGLAGNMSPLRRVAWAAMTGVIIGLLYTLAHWGLEQWLEPPRLGVWETLWEITESFMKRGFFIGVFAMIGAVLEELFVFRKTPHATAAALPLQAPALAEGVAEQ